MDIKSRINSPLFRQAGVYTISSYLNKAIPFLLLPILTHYLTTEDYGEVEMFLALSGLLVAVFGWSLDGAYMRKYFDKGNSLGIINFNYFIILTVSFAACALVSVIFTPAISKYSGVTEPYIILAVATAFFSVICGCTNSYHQAKEAPVHYALFTNGWTLTNALLSIILIVLLGLGAKGRIWGISLAAAIFGIIGFFIIRKSGCEKKIDRVVIKEEFSVFGFPTLPMNLRGTALKITDKLLIVNILGMSEAGVYTVGTQLAMVIDVFVRSIVLAYTPWVYKKLAQNDKESDRKIVKSLYLIICLIIIVSVLWLLMCRVGLHWFVAEGYWGASSFLPWLVFSNSLLGIQLLLVNFIYFKMKTKLYSLVSIVSLGLNILMNFLLINSEGTIGAAKATFYVYIITLIATVFIVLNYYRHLPWRLKRMN